MRISSAAAIGALDNLTTRLNTGGAGKIEIRTGSQPTNVDDAASGTLLATLNLSATAFAGAIDGGDNAQATANSIAATTGAATGTAAWFRAYAGNGTAVVDGNISATGGGADLELNSTTINTGGNVTVTSWVITKPK